jgi:hypothetical protein
MTEYGGLHLKKSIRRLGYDGRQLWAGGSSALGVRADVEFIPTPGLFALTEVNRAPMSGEILQCEIDDARTDSRPD